AGRSMRIVSTPPLFSVPMSMQVSSRRRCGQRHCAYNPPMDRDGFIASIVLVVVFAAGLRAVRDSFWRVALLSLPGTIAHELSHLVVGYALGARPQRFSLWPRREGKRWILGFVTFGNLNVLNAAPVALAPLALLPLALL